MARQPVIALPGENLKSRNSNRVAISLLGGFEVLVDGRRVTPETLGRRDPVRLAEFLALAPSRRVHREQLVDTLWPDVAFESVANRLHKAAHFVRKATGRSDSVVLSADTVALFPTVEPEIDAVTFERLAVDGLASGDRATMDRAIALYVGDLLPYDLYEDWAFHHRQRLRLRYRELLRATGDYQRLIAVDPTDEDGHVGVMRQLLHTGDRSGVLRHYEALSQILDQELGVGPSIEARSLRDLALGPARPNREFASAADEPPRSASLSVQRVHFCTTTDDVRLAYASSGSGPPLVKASTWLTHLDYDWDSPVWRHWWQELSSRHTLIRYDERGCGLSDWDIDAASYTLDAWVRDLETVVDALGLERFPLLGISQGGPIAITYAARHPERVSHVIVYGTCARATWTRASDERRRELAALGELIKLSWGSDQPGFRQVYDAKFLPDGPLEQWRAFDELQRRSTSPRNAHLLWKAFGGLDCSEAARQLDVPTLIAHAADDQVWSFEEAEELHAMVPGSELVKLASNNHILQAHEPAFAELIDVIEEFLVR
jgi:pimeloyl-ACP methyl ester carboxylesterase/DNA-binding SARP family transcriptional activator